MSAYVPPYPVRPKTTPPPLTLLRLARRNLLSVWTEEAFELPVFSHRVFRRNVVVINSPEIVKQTFVDGAADIERKTFQQRSALRPLAGDGLIISDGDTWRRRRKAIAPVTHVSRLPLLTEPISEGAWAEAERWRALPTGAEIDVLAGMAHLTAGIICATIFGRALGRAATGTVVTAFGVYQTLINQLDVMSLLGVPDLLPRFQGWRIRAAARRIHKVVDALIAQIMDPNASGEPSLLRTMAETKLADTDAPMDRRAFRNEAAVMFLAGHETTANTLAWAWFLLSQDHEAERRLHAEVDAVLPLDGPARHEHLASLPFARAIIEETLRLYPPVPLQARQASAPMSVAGRALRKGDIVILNAWTLHRNRKLWAEPDSFIPDRFMPGGSGIPSRYAYVPFSIGPRICTGAAFGLAEAVLCLATLSRHIRLRLRPGHVVEPVCRLSLRPGEVLPMTVQHRR